MICCGAFAASLIERYEADTLSAYISHGVTISIDEFEKRIDEIEWAVDVPASVTRLPGIDSYEEMSKRLVDTENNPQEQTARNILDVYQRATREERKYFIAVLVSMLYSRTK